MSGGELILLFIRVLALIHSCAKATSLEGYDMRGERLIVVVGDLIPANVCCQLKSPRKFYTRLGGKTWCKTEGRGTCCRKMLREMRGDNTSKEKVC